MGINAPLQSTQEMRNIARLLSIDAHVAAREGDYERCARDLKAIFATSDALALEPCIVSQLVRIAVFSIGVDGIQTLLPFCEFDDEQLSSIQIAMCNADFRRAIQRGVIGERAISLDYSGQMIKVPIVRESNQRNLLEEFDRIIKPDDDNASWTELNERYRKAEVQLQKIKPGPLNFNRIAVAMLMPAFGNSMEAGSRVATRQRCAIAGIAARRFELSEGKAAETLAQLERYLPDNGRDMNDPFSGESLRFRNEDSQVIVYGVGTNLVDDGGDIELSPDQRSFADIGFRLEK